MPSVPPVLVLTLQHEVAAGMVQLIDGSHGTGLAALSTTLNFALDRRDQALQDIVDLAPPAPPVAEDASAGPKARAAGTAPAGSTFESVMPSYTGVLDDEIQGIEGLKSDATDLTAGGRNLPNSAETRITKTKGFVSRTWPPLPPTDD